MIKLSCVRAWREDFFPNASDPCERSKEGRGGFTSACLYSQNPPKIPKEPQRKYLTAVLCAAKLFL